MEYVVVVHDLEQAEAALETAAELNLPITLQSPPEAIFYAGSLYVKHMFEEACRRHPKACARFILDCADSGAEAIAAIQTGHLHLRSSADAETRAKLADIAVQYGVTLTDAPYEALDLQAERDWARSCKDWLQKHAKD